MTSDEDLSYECLLRLHVCYQSLSGRDYTCESLLKRAVSLDPKKPEAYFLLSQMYERKGNWMDCHLYSSLPLEISSCKKSKLTRGVGYEGKYCLLFQKAVSSWWHGRPDESRRILQELKNDYSEEMTEAYYGLVEKNISRLGSGPDSQSSSRYESSRLDSLRIKFEGAEKIERNFSQVYQDMFVLSVLGGKREGTYLEIGSGHPFHNNNTALLEQLGWKGVGLELNREMCDEYNRLRTNKCMLKDALKVNYKKLLSDNFPSDIVDYLQLDIEPPKNTFEVLLSIPFEKYRFRVITYEHDHYVDMTKSYREKSRRYLSSMGYTLAVGDVSPDEKSPFEDWWVLKELVDESALGVFISIASNETNMAKDFMLSK
jgi:hypothetical protein